MAKYLIIGFLALMIGGGIYGIIAVAKKIGSAPEHPVKQKVVEASPEQENVIETKKVDIVSVETITDLPGITDGKYNYRSGSVTATGLVTSETAGVVESRDRSALTVSVTSRAVPKRLQIPFRGRVRDLETGELQAVLTADGKSFKLGRENSFGRVVKLDDDCIRLVRPDGGELFVYDGPVLQDRAEETAAVPDFSKAAATLIPEKS